MSNTFYLGQTQILYILVSGIKVPISCLTENSLSESVDMLETTTQDNKGWKTGQPLNQSYNISFSGVQIVSNVSPPTQASLDVLKILKRRRELINWVIETETTFIEGGSGFITSLTDSSAAEGLLTFSGNILGYGALAIESLATPDNYIFQDGENYIFQDSNNYIFQ